MRDTSAAAPSMRWQQAVAAPTAASPFLVAAPASVLPNWEAEFARWAPSLRVVAYRGTAPEREAVFARQMRGGARRGGGAAPPPFDVCLTSHDHLMGREDRWAAGLGGACLLAQICSVVQHPRPKPRANPPCLPACLPVCLPACLPCTPAGRAWHASRGGTWWWMRGTA